MVEWGGHLGSWGFNAIVLDLCNTFDHQRNGEAVAELATTLGLSDVLYLGFSAGGLASLVAAANSNPLGVMTLDPVDDFGGTGSTLGGQVSSPVLGLIGEPLIATAKTTVSDCYKQLVPQVFSESPMQTTVTSKLLQMTCAKMASQDLVLVETPLLAFLMTVFVQLSVKWLLLDSFG